MYIRAAHERREYDPDSTLALAMIEATAILRIDHGLGAYEHHLTIEFVIFAIQLPSNCRGASADFSPTLP